NAAPLRSGPGGAAPQAAGAAGLALRGGGARLRCGAVDGSHRLGGRSAAFGGRWAGCGHTSRPREWCASSLWGAEGPEPGQGERRGEGSAMRARRGLGLALTGALLAAALGSAWTAPAAPEPTAERRAQLQERDRLLAQAQQLARAGRLEEAIKAAEKVLAI